MEIWSRCYAKKGNSRKITEEGKWKSFHKVRWNNGTFSNKRWGDVSSRTRTLRAKSHMCLINNKFNFLDWTKREEGKADFDLLFHEHFSHRSFWFILRTCRKKKFNESFTKFHLIKIRSQFECFGTRSLYPAFSQLKFDFQENSRKVRLGAESFALTIQVVQW